MTEYFADLHVHTDCSDGIYSPRRVVDEAERIGLKAVAITDHDCTEGLSEAFEHARPCGVELIPGVEISARCCDSDIHILGYFVDWKEESFASLLERITLGRVERIHETIDLLKRSGIEIEFEEVKKAASRGSLGRMQLARTITKKGLAHTPQEVFRKYIRDGGPCYVPHRKVDYAEAIASIRSSGGIAVLAHPGMMGAEEHIDLYIEAGLRGIEVFHSKHSAANREKYMSLALKKNLLVTGGSDCHGAEKYAKHSIGSSGVSRERVEKLRKEARSMRDEK